MAQGKRSSALRLGNWRRLLRGHGWQDVEPDEPTFADRLDDLVRSRLGEVAVLHHAKDQQISTALREG